MHIYPLDFRSNPSGFGEFSLSTGVSTVAPCVDERCGYPVDYVDKSVNSRGIAALFACWFVDKPVETVDDSAFGCA